MYVRTYTRMCIMYNIHICGMYVCAFVCVTPSYSQLACTLGTVLKRIAISVSNNMNPSCNF